MSRNRLCKLLLLQKVLPKGEEKMKLKNLFIASLISLSSCATLEKHLDSRDFDDAFYTEGLCQAKAQ